MHEGVDYLGIIKAMAADKDSFTMFSAAPVDLYAEQGARLSRVHSIIADLEHEVRHCIDKAAYYAEVGEREIGHMMTGRAGGCREILGKLKAAVK